MFPRCLKFFVIMVFIYNKPSHNLKSSELLKQQINDFSSILPIGPNTIGCPRIRALQFLSHKHHYPPLHIVLLWIEIIPHP